VPALFCDERIGADAYGEDAIEAVDVAKSALTIVTDVIL